MTSKSPLPISLVIITLNEEKNLARCIKSASFVAEVIVLDSGSTDQTQSIAQSLGARFEYQEWLGYGAQKQKATKMANQEWILSLDADEALSPELAQEIQDLFQSKPSVDGFKIPRRSFHLGRWINHGGWYPDWQLRLFRPSQCHWSESGLHEAVDCSNAGRLTKPILHWVFDDLEDQVSTNNKYSTLGAVELKKSGRSFSLFKLLVKPWSKFIETYILKRGFLDGLPGFIISVGAAYSVFLKHAKLWEMNKTSIEK